MQQQQQQQQQQQAAAAAGMRISPAPQQQQQPQLGGFVQRPPAMSMPPPGSVMLTSAAVAANPALLSSLRAGMPGGAFGGPSAGMAGGLGGAPAASSDVYSSAVVNAESVVSAHLPVRRRLLPGGGFAPVPAPDEHGRILTRAQLDRLMRMQGLDGAFSLAPEVVAELTRAAEDFVADAVERGAQLAAARKANTLRASDLAPYLERAHHIRVPGFGGELKPYRRPSASELHRERAAAVRQSGAGGGGGGAGGPQRRG
ncbi:transcription initiation factor TFIID subunit 12 [Raphidocelis subcapitata]|uniref:Transcription initiation factor TFIID subunit 12 n=1 Tax=Raphidocelis subcapitata TaxID=307507 RepID=A0A2V0NSK3_9CHLO|nr:transcription initiation factor TFIID subunit 12 [Raphidocelis subcapitata]|eukprot:GBF87907.1 transcription initiation factor TFIID subunit 12 [Raphidocelis subcapitata]